MDDKHLVELKEEKGHRVALHYQRYRWAYS